MDPNESISTRRSDFSASMSSRRAAEAMAKKREDERDFSFALKMARIFSVLGVCILLCGIGLSFVGLNSEHYSLRAVANSTELEPDLFLLRAYFILRQVGPIFIGCGTFSVIVAFIVALDYYQYKKKISTVTKTPFNLKTFIRSLRDRLPCFKSYRHEELATRLSFTTASRRASMFSLSSTLNNNRFYNQRNSVCTDQNLLRPDWSFSNSAAMKRKLSLSPTPTQPPIINRPILIKRHSTGLKWMRRTSIVGEENQGVERNAVEQT